MTKLLQQAIDKAQALPPDRQDDIARMVLSYAGMEQSFVDLTADEEASVMRSREAAARGDFATDDELQTIRAKHIS